MWCEVPLGVIKVEVVQQYRMEFVRRDARMRFPFLSYVLPTRPANANRPLARVQIIAGGAAVPAAAMAVAAQPAQGASAIPAGPAHLAPGRRGNGFGRGFSNGFGGGLRRGGYARAGKYVLDVALILLTAPLWLPIVAICALALWLEGGQPFYWQDRLGRGGARFRIVKLRTMVRDADARLAECLARDPALRAEWDATQKLKHDPRVTRVGAFLRATSLDELPQFWNVLRGEMSLVGPRPMMPEQLPLYGDPKAYFALRPGITGLWQVSARNESRFDYRATLDAVYLASLSPLRDLQLMLRTVGVVLRRTGY